MDLDQLIAIGLSQTQAEVYLYLIKNGAQKPAVIAEKLRLTRTNAYKILDSMVDIGIIEKDKIGKTLAYKPGNPLALATLTATYRAEAVAREEKVNRIMHELLATYSQHTKKPGVTTYSGRDKVAEAYRKQINLREDVKFIHTKTDVPMMGYDLMSEIRTTPARLGNKRQSIMSAPTHKSINFQQHERSNMTVTWIESGLYTAPVEWSVTKSSLLIATYDGDPQAILIIDPVVSMAFDQIFDMLRGFARQADTHKQILALAPSNYVN